MTPVTDDGKLLINFFGSPAAGKTVAATSLFAALKRNHVDTVLVSEFAHHRVIEENSTGLKNQLWIWANQQYNIFCGYNHATVTVTDSPILLGAIYNTDASPALLDVIFEQHHRYNNLNVVMELDLRHPYSMTGRVHSLTESLTIQSRIFDMLDEREIPYIRYSEVTEDDLVKLVMDAIE